MGSELVFLVLIAVVLVFGVGVLLVSRSRVRRQDTAAARTSVTLEGAPPSLEEAESEADVLVEERPRFRDRLGKARAALTGRSPEYEGGTASTPSHGTSWRRRSCGPMSA